MLADACALKARPQCDKKQPNVFTDRIICNWAPSSEPTSLFGECSLRRNSSAYRDDELSLFD